MELFWEWESTHSSEGTAQPSDTCDTSELHRGTHRAAHNSHILRIRTLAASLGVQDVTAGWVYMANTSDI